MKRFMNDTAYRDLFFFGFVTMVEVAVPKAFPIVMVYFYLVAIIGHCVLFAIGRFKFAFITYIVKNVFVFAIIMSLLVDKWCEFFQFRDNNSDFS